MSIYKDCDIRGIYWQEFDDETACAIGRAIGTIMEGKRLVVGGDIRLSTPALKASLIKGLVESGVHVWDIETCPTPAFYFSIHRFGADGGVMVTASHNPPEYNGFKVALGAMPVTSADIQKIQGLVNKGVHAVRKGSMSVYKVMRTYEDALVGAFRPGSGKIVVDCGNGAMSEVAPRVFSRLGYDVVPLFCRFDGRFPKRDPNPAVYEHLGALCKRVRACDAQMGVAFDGDGDRAVFVDNRGRVIPSEQSFAMMIQNRLKAGESVVYDLKSSSIVRNETLRCGGVPLMERSGHAFIKRRFLENQSALAGEISGHFFFRELGYDDGLYAAVVMMQLAEEIGDLAERVDQLEKPVISPDIRIHCPYEQQDDWLARVRAMEGGEISTMDGVRVAFPTGWILVRKSVTEEGITVRMEAENEEVMAKLKNDLLERLPALRAHPFFADFADKEC